MVLNEDSVYHGGYFRVSTKIQTERHGSLERVTDDMTHDTDRRQGRETWKTHNDTRGRGRRKYADMHTGYRPSHATQPDILRPQTTPLAWWSQSWFAVVLPCGAGVLKPSSSRSYIGHPSAEPRTAQHHPRHGRCGDGGIWAHTSSAVALPFFSPNLPTCPHTTHHTPLPRCGLYIIEFALATEIGNL